MNRCDRCQTNRVQLVLDCGECGHLSPYEYVYHGNKRTGEMGLIEKLKAGCVQARKRWSGDCGEVSLVDEQQTDALLMEAAERIEALETALQRIYDCKWPTMADRPEWMREIAKNALK